LDTSEFGLHKVNAIGLQVDASLFVGNIGFGNFIGLAESGAFDDINITLFELDLYYDGCFSLSISFVEQIVTVPEYLRKPFGGQRIRVYPSSVALFLHIFTRISVNGFHIDNDNFYDDL
uniref:Lectin_legB domain-containing protein n=1 Tax=Hymenolepis diminuta TaxID=6216 RepID=A0A0R3SAG0_HYMDI